MREEEAAARLRVSSLERNPNGGSLGKSGWFVPDAHRGSPSSGGLAGIVRDEEAKAAAAAAAAREAETAAAAAAARTPAARRRKAGNKPPREPTKDPTKERTKASTKAPTKEPSKEPLKEPSKERTKEPLREPSKEPRRPNSRRGKKKNEASSADSKPARSKHRRASRLATDATDAKRFVSKKGPSEASPKRRETDASTPVASTRSSGRVDANPPPIKPPRVVPRASGEEKKKETVPTRDTFEGGR